MRCQASPTRRRLAVRSQVAAACKQIARYIRSHKLAVGDTLPPQEELRQTLGFSNNTLSPAMKLLVEMGLLTRSNGAGTVIRDLAPLNRLTWTIGLAVMDLPIQGPGAFHAWLLHAMQSQLSKRHCTSHNYFRVEDPQWPHHRLEDFPGLAEDVDDGAIDGLITLEVLDASARATCASAGIPLLLCGVGRCEEMPLAVLGDSRGMIADAATALIGQGARRLALVTGDDDGDPDARAFAALVQRAARANGGNDVATELLPAGIGVQSGEEAALALAQRAAARRPDAMIVVDDFTALGMARVLAAQTGDLPRMAVLAHKQFSQPWPLPVMSYEIDIAEVAAHAVKTLQESLLNPALPPRQEWVKARLAE